jgi:hypothetical protein
MIERRIEWPLILAVACALVAVFVMVHMLNVDLALESKLDPAEIAGLVLAELADTPTGREGADALVTSDGGVALWVAAAVAALFGFLLSAKAMAERITLRRLRRRRRARLTREIEERLAAEATRV